MSQKGVEALLGRMVTDGDFRRRFYQEPAATCGAAVVEVTTRELEAVLAVDEAHIGEFSKMLDARIVRAHVNGVPQSHAKPEWTLRGHLGGVAQTAVSARQYRVR